MPGGHDEVKKSARRRDGERNQTRAVQKTPPSPHPEAPEPFPLGPRWVDEVVEQAPRLALGAGLLAGILASGRFDPGPELARALGVYLVRIALSVFLVSYAAIGLHRHAKSRWPESILRGRSALDTSVALLFALHLVAVWTYLRGAGIAVSVPRLGLPAIGAIALLLRPWLASRADQKAYQVASDVTWLVFAGFYARIVFGTAGGRFSGTGTALGWLTLLGLALALRVAGAIRAPGPAKPPQ